MNSRDLADRVETTIRDCRARIEGVGHEQYGRGDEQLFETMPLIELIEYLREEVLDVVNYAVMLDIRYQRILERLAKEKLA